MNNNNSSAWYVLRVKSLHEKKIHRLLLESSIEAFLPLIKTTRNWSDRKKIILKPLFPSYIFVNIHSSVDFYRALDLNGAYSYISFGNDGYTKVKEHEINRIKLLLGDKEISDIELEPKRLKVGSYKKISFGSLRGLECKLLKINNINKVKVMIESLRQEITATIPSSYLVEI